MPSLAGLGSAYLVLPRPTSRANLTRHMPLRPSGSVVASFCAPHLQANSSMFVYFPCFLLSAQIVCAGRNTVNDSGLPLCIE